MLVIFYYIRDDIKNLLISLQSLIKQTAPFGLHLINDSQNQQVDQIIEGLDFSNIKDFSYLKSSKTITPGYYFNKINQIGANDYVWAAGPNCIFGDMCIEKLNKIIDEKSPDVCEISKTGVISNQEPFFINIDEQEKFAQYISPYFYDKICRISFLKNNQINFNRKDTQTLDFILNVFIHTSQILKISESLLTYRDAVNNYSNVYEIIFMIKHFIQKNSHVAMYKQHQELFEFYYIGYIFDIFLYHIFTFYTDTRPRTNACVACQSLTKDFFPNYRTNKFLSKPNYLSPALTNFCNNFTTFDDKRMLKKLANFYGDNKKN